MIKSRFTIIAGLLIFQTGAMAQIYVKNPGNVGIGVAQPTAKLQVSNEGNASFRVGITSNMSNSNAQILSTLSVLGESHTATSSCGAVAWDFYNNGNSPSWAGALLQHVGNGVTGNQNGMLAANQGILNFQNVSNGVITSNGANIHIAPQNTVVASFLTTGMRLSAGSEFYFADNGQIRSLDNNHRILFRRAEDKMELREYGSIIFSAGAIAGAETATMAVSSNGNVGIGTASPGYKLHVIGDIRATKLIADGNTWADYVFDSSYQLPSLQYVETYIKQHHHLPEVPSTEEVKKNGISISDNQVVLLKKIEELTLYIIDQNKKQQEQNATQNDQHDRLKLLEEKFNELLEENNKLKKEVVDLKAKTQAVSGK